MLGKLSRTNSFVFLIVIFLGSFIAYHTFGYGEKGHSTLSSQPELMNMSSDGENPGRSPVKSTMSLTVTPAPTESPIVGRIVDSQSGQPITATIQLRRTEISSDTETIISNEAGGFQVSRQALPVTLEIEKPGYKLWKKRLTFTNIRTEQELEAKLIPRTTLVSVSMADIGEPLAETDLVISVNDEERSVKTTRDGTFELLKLLPGDRVAVWPQNEYLPQESEYEGKGNLSLLLKPRQITVTVLSSLTRQPISDTTLTLNQALSATTNVKGQAVLSHVPAEGEITVIERNHHETTVNYENGEPAAIEIAPVAVQGMFRGGDTKQPLPRATIYWDDTIFQADDKGYFIIENLPLKPADVMIKAAGYHRTYGKLSRIGVYTNYDQQPFAGVEGRWLQADACAPSDNLTTLPCLDITLKPFKARAIYVPFQYLGNREAMISYFDFLSSTDHNAITVDVKGDFGKIAWESNVKLVQEIGADDWRQDYWMPLEDLVAEAKSRNIYTIARLVVFKDDPLAHGKSELAVVRADGSPWIDGEGLGWANPFREEVWDYNIALAKEVAAAGFDELNFDYIRFPSDGYVDAIVYEQENTLETRTTAIRQFMTRLSEELRPYGVFISADVFGLTVWVEPESDMRIGQRIIDVAPQVDYLAPMVYPTTFIPGNLGYDNPSAEPYGVVFRSQERAMTIVPPYVKVRPWLQAYWYDIDEMLLLKQAAVDANAAGWTWWNSGGKYDDALFVPADEEDE